MSFCTSLMMEMDGIDLNSKQRGKDNLGKLIERLDRVSKTTDVKVSYSLFRTVELAQS